MHHFLCQTEFHPVLSPSFLERLHCCYIYLHCFYNYYNNVEPCALNASFSIWYPDLIKLPYFADLTQGTKYPLTSSVWHCFRVAAPPPDPTFTPSTFKTDLATGPHAFDVHVIWWPHLHLLHVIRQTHQFPSSVHPCRPLLTLISRLSSNFVSSVIVDCNTIDDICNMICVL